MKKILAIVLAVVMLLPVFAVNVFAADEPKLRVQVYSQSTVDWGWHDAVTVDLKPGESHKFELTNFDGWAGQNATGNFRFGILVTDLQLTDEVGDSSTISYTVSDVTIKATGFDDFVVPGNTVDKVLTVYKESLGAIAGKDNIFSFQASENPWGSDNAKLAEYLGAITEISFDFKFNSYKDDSSVEPEESNTEDIIFKLARKEIKDAWNDGFIIKGADTSSFVRALQKEGAQFKLVYTVTKENWCNFNINGNGSTYVDGTISNDPKKTNLGAPVTGIDMTVGENKELTMSGADFLKFFTDMEGTECKGLWSPNGSINVGDIYHGFDDINNIESIQIQPAEGGIFTVESLTVSVPKVAQEVTIFKLARKEIKDAWNDGFIIKGADTSSFVRALQKEGAQFKLVYTVTKENWCNFNINGNGSTYVDGTISGDPKKTNLGAPVTGIDMTVGENKELTMSGADFLKFFTDMEGTECKGLWSPNGSINVGDIYHGFDDINNIESIQIQPAEGGIFTVESLTVTVMAYPEAKKAPRGNVAFTYINEDFHAYRMGKQFVPLHHTDNGAGYCIYCNAVLPTEVEEGDKSVFVLEKTGGQDYQSAPGVFADGVVLADTQEGKGNARIATNWIDSNAYNGIVNAVKTENAWLKITYTGKLNSVIFQTEKTSAPEAFEITAPAVVEEGEQNVAWFNCADIVANSPVGLSGDFGGWANFMLNFEGDTTVYGFEVVVPEVVPVAE